MNHKLLSSRWFCTQQGAREHYAIPVALSTVGVLDTFVTDFWMANSFSARCLRLFGQKRLQGRFHPDLAKGKVCNRNFRFFWSEVRQRWCPRKEYDYFAERNRVFDSFSSQILRKRLDDRSPPDTVFAYANSCKDLFETAKKKECRTILGQFDPGPIEARIVNDEVKKHPEFKTSWVSYPESYTQRWFEEVKLADTILINSRWSQDCLTQVGVPKERMRILPLVYRSTDASVEPRQYPVAFNSSRPLVILFLGQVILRKGIARLINAVKLLKNEPIVVHLVGPTDIQNLQEMIADLPIRFHGSVSRADVHQFYRQADVFILPTLSDGSAITQLEALSWRLPVIGTNFCGEVIEHDRNGLILEDLEPATIAQSIVSLLKHPEMLGRWSFNSLCPIYNHHDLAKDLLGLAKTP